MELEIIISVIITTIALLIIALIAAVVFLNKRINRLNETLIDVDLRIDPIRLNFLWGLRTALYQQEKYESISDVNEIIEDEFGKEAVNHISHEDFFGHDLSKLLLLLNIGRTFTTSKETNSNN